MPGQRPLLAMSFVASLGLTLDILACTYPKDANNFWPLLVFIFYFLAPLPLMMSRRIQKDSGTTSYEVSQVKLRDLALFVTSGLMVSTMALPIVLARSPIAHPLISWVSCILVLFGNVLCFMTIGLFCLYFV